ncbi:hypothetical protein L6452_24008 [Arctium lappa]|uniref:Uncharacterized protein n=1 Tax=Arctium lappa TaxID=4217 RepID=A0ACB9A9X9_ARCLA|nr:hypothetical protein L6452_24008 [Arctium lappa]
MKLERNMCFTNFIRPQEPKNATLIACNHQSIGSSILGQEFNPERARFLAHEGVDKYDFRGNNLNFFSFGSDIEEYVHGLPLVEKLQMYVSASLLHSFDWKFGEEHDFYDIFCVTPRKS